MHFGICTELKAHIMYLYYRIEDCIVLFRHVFHFNGKVVIFGRSIDDGMSTKKRMPCMTVEFRIDDVDKRVDGVLENAVRTQSWKSPVNGKLRKAPEKFHAHVRISCR